MNIHRIPIFHDNYVFLLSDGRQAFVVDPGDALPVLNALEALHLTLAGILVTHHHPDHIGGIPTLLHSFPDAHVYAGAADWGRIPGQTHGWQGGETLTILGERVDILFLPGHTLGHIAYYFPERGDLFCGDTLFAGGCGRIIEGDPEQMLRSLTTIRQLPDHTRIWCAHEYTLKNLQFALTVDPDNPDLQSRYHQVQRQRQQGEATIPSALPIERATNPFLRWDQPALQRATSSRDPVRVLARLRGKKDMF